MGRAEGQGGTRARGALEAEKGAKTGSSGEQEALEVLQLKGRSEGAGRRGRARAPFVTCRAWGPTGSWTSSLQVMRKASARGGDFTVSSGKRQMKP